MEYSIRDHKHRFAAWAASRAASVKGCRFSVQRGKAILEDAGLNQLLADPAKLPAPKDIDASHLEWRAAVVVAAMRQGLDFTHGVAAKLINVYQKACFVCGGQDTDPRVQALHPPIDGVLLKELYRKNVGELRQEWSKAKTIRWSKFTADEYQDVITSIRSALGEDVPLWHIEKHWRGYQ